MLDFAFIFIINMMGLPASQVSTPTAAQYLNWNSAMNYATSHISSTANILGIIHVNLGFLATLTQWFVAVFYIVGNFFLLIGQYLLFLFNLGTAPVKELIFPVNVIFESIVGIVLAIVIATSIEIGMSNGVRK